MTPTSYRSHIQDILENKISKQTCWQFAGATISFLPHITNWGDTHLRRKVTTFYINLQRAGCQSAICLKTPHPHPHPILIREDDRGVAIRNGLTKIQISKIITQPLWLCIQFVFYSSLHFITLKYCFRNIFLPKILLFFSFLFFLNCTLLQTTACNEVKHHRNNAGIQQKSCLSTTSNTNVLLVYKSNRIKEYILKSEK